ncbi:MAG: TolC family protein [Treponema sp.]|nr:TolC family protein [Treponema sp.]
MIINKKGWNWGKTARRRLAEKLVIPFCIVMMILLTAKLQAQEIQGQQPMHLSPDQAVELAIRSNLSLESSRVNLETRRRASQLSWNQFLPNVTVMGILNRESEQTTQMSMPFPMFDPSAPSIPGNIGGIPGNIFPSLPSIFVPNPIDIPQWNMIGNVQISLTLSTAMIENMRRLRLDYETGLVSFERAKLQLERDVRKAYHNMLLLKENIALMHLSFENIERQVQMAQANFNAGLAPELTLLQASVARENMRPVIEQVENGFALAMAQFAMFLGLPFDTQFELIPIITEDIGFIPLNAMELISQAAVRRPDILELQQTVVMLESARRMQVNTLHPFLNLSWNTNRIFTRDPWNDSWFNNDYWTSRGAFSVQFGLRLHSLLPFSTDFQGIRSLDDQITTTNIGLSQLITGTQIEVYNTVLTLERTRANAHAMVQTVALAEQSFRLTQEAYRAGLQDYFQVQNAEQSLHQARVQLLEQRFNYLNGLIDLEYFIGVPFGTLSTGN